MKTFLEYTFDVDNVVKLIGTLRADQRDYKHDKIETLARSGDHLNKILANLPQEELAKLPDNARADLAQLMITVINHHLNRWNEFKNYIQKLWDQPVSTPGKTLGKELLNNISSATMRHITAPFFISYSGPLTKHSLFTYTNAYPKLVIVNKNYGYGTLNQIERAVQGDYTERFNNNRELESQIKGRAG
jgi:hypothetical protein